ncbi:hypothetical protein AMTR_s00159p00018480 [Amborella trichopoda]|uniref:Uncharacterized protein n=1 Tax=Amborella trichopoda TaxID=13333 RepID=W1PXF6_AMBTC|nr:hypothetical protein AMTR_s00159p00018480 [Amborella trichopoda]
MAALSGEGEGVVVGGSAFSSSYPVVCLRSIILLKYRLREGIDHGKDLRVPGPVADGRVVSLPRKDGVVEQQKIAPIQPVRWRSMVSTA